MGHLRRHLCKTTFFDMINLVADADFVTALQDVNGFLTRMVNMQRRPAERRDLDEVNNKVSNYISTKLAADFDERYPHASANATECAMNLVRTAEVLEKKIAGLLTAFDLSPATGLVLCILTDAEGPISPNMIADHLIISRASVTSLLDSLEKRGYARRRPHPTDRRMIWVEPTDLGRQIADDFRPIVHQHQKSWLSVLSTAEQEQMIDMLHRLQLFLLEPDR